MNAALPAPRSLGQILRLGLSTYRSAFVSLIPLMILAMLVNAAAQALAPALALVLTPSVLASAMQRSAQAASLLAAAMVRVYIAVAMLRRLHEVATGRGTMTGIDGFARPSRFYWRAVTLFIVIGIAVSLGILCVVLPGVYLFVRWYLAVVALVIEDQAAGDSLRRSGKLIEGHWWLAAGIVGLSLLSAVAIGAALGALTALALSLSQVTVAETGAPMLAPGGLLVISLVVSAAWALLLPLYYAFALWLFYELRASQGGERITQAY